MIKAVTKQIIAKTFSRLNYPLLINSYGRSGSTVLTRSIVKGAINIQNDLLRKVANRSIFQATWNLASVSLKNGIVYKTHDYPPANNKIKKDVRMLYTFANPVDAVLSLLRLYDERGEEWMKVHYNHLKVPYDNFGNIVEEDHLKLESHLNAWLNEDRFPIAFIKYEEMWNHVDEVSDFLGFNIELPPFRKRKAKKNYNPELISDLEKTYGSLKKTLENIDDFFIRNT